MGFPLHLDTMLRYCQAATVVMNQNKVTIGGLLAAVQGDMDTHPGSPGLSNMMSGLSGMNGLQAISSLTGLNLSQLGGLSSLAGLSNIGNLTGALSGANSLLGGMGVNLGGLTSAMSGIGLNMGSVGNFTSIVGAISSQTGMTFSAPGPRRYGSGGDLGQLNSLASAAGGLQNIGGLPGMGSIPGVGSLGNYLNVAQGILGLGGNMGNIANMANMASSMVGGGGPGALIAIKDKITIQGKPLIVAMADKAMPDMIGMIFHPTTPTDPAQGSNKVSAYGGAGTAGMLQGLMNGKFNIQELVKVGQQVMGKISSMSGAGAGGGGGSGSMALQGMTPGTQPQVGQTIVGVESGATMTVTSVDIDDKYNGTAYAPDYSYINDYGLSDDAGIVALAEHFTGLPSQEYQTEYVVINDR